MGVTVAAAMLPPRQKPATGLMPKVVCALRARPGTLPGPPEWTARPASGQQSQTVGRVPAVTAVKASPTTFHVAGLIILSVILMKYGNL